jgi:large subunit ribosomal protein L24
MNKIIKGDKVQVMRGKDAGKQGEIEAVIVDKDTKKVKVLIKGVNIVKKAQKPNPTLGIEGGIIQVEKPIDASNVMVIDPKSNKPSRVGFKIDEKTGKKTRIFKKSAK